MQQHRLQAANEGKRQEIYKKMLNTSHSVLLFFYISVLFSLFNLDEVNMVVSYIEILLTTKFCKHNLLSSDIGIVTPYKIQATKIMSRCEELFPAEASGLTIGTAAILQGQEKQAIIVSTVSVGNISDFAANPRVFTFKLLIFKTYLKSNFEC